MFHRSQTFIILFIVCIQQKYIDTISKRRRTGTLVKWERERRTLSTGQSLSHKRVECLYCNTRSNQQVDERAVPVRAIYLHSRRHTDTHRLHALPSLHQGANVWNIRTFYTITSERDVGKMKLYFRKKSVWKKSISQNEIYYTWREINIRQVYNFSLSFVASLELISWTIGRLRASTNRKKKLLFS